MVTGGRIKSPFLAVWTLLRFGKGFSSYSHIMMESETRLWGKFEVLTNADGYKVKRITVVPGGRLSLQSHKHRAEHWVVVTGVAKVTIHQDVNLVPAGNAVFIPLGARHRLENETNSDMVLIEIQQGDYLGEDDIVRYDDAYGRA